MDMKDENKEKVDIELITAYATNGFFSLCKIVEQKLHKKQ